MILRTRELWRLRWALDGQIYFFIHIGFLIATFFPQRAFPRFGYMPSLHGDEISGMPAEAKMIRYGHRGRELTALKHVYVAR